MSEVWFYHLTQQPLEQALPQLLEAAQSRAGWRVIVRGTDRERLAWLDEKLWLLGDDSFLAHGLAGGAHDADQPVLLTDAAQCPNAAACLMLIDGAAYGAADMAQFARVCVLFDGNDPAALTAARGQWKQAADAGYVAKYQSQETGRWALKAQIGA